MKLNELAPEECAIAAELGERRPLAARRPRLGEILLAAGEISESQLRAALERKQTTGRRIGEELVAAGLVSADRLARALGLQRKLLLAALFTALMGQANAAEQRAYMTVSANVVDTVGIRPLYQAQELVISAQDVERGFVEIASASRFEIRNPRPSLFEFRSVGDVFRSVHVTGNAGAADFGSQGGTLLQKPPGNGVSSVALNYRFELSPGVRPGTHKWPLALTVVPM